MIAVCSFGSDLMGDSPSTLCHSNDTASTVFFVSVTGDSAKADKHLG